MDISRGAFFLSIYRHNLLLYGYLCIRNMSTASMVFEYLFSINREMGLRAKRGHRRKKEEPIPIR